MATKVIAVEVRNGLKFNFDVPADIGTFNERGKDRPADPNGFEPVLSDAIDTNLYRGGLPTVWDQLAKLLFEEYKVARLTKPHPNKEKAAKGETVDGETDPHYVDRVAEVVGVDLAKPEGLASFQKLIDQRIGTVELDLSAKKVGGTGAALVGKGDMEMAKAYMDAGHEKLTKALAKIAKLLGGKPLELSGDAAKDQYAIALQIKAFRAESAKSLIQ